MSTPGRNRANKIRDLNDAFRSDLSSGHLMLTRGVHALGLPGSAAAIRKMVEFAAFTPENDPYGEHDFGIIELDGEKLYWKIDYFERDSGLTAGAEHPEDATTTERVVTIMLASEY